MADKQSPSAHASRRLPARPNLEHLKNEAKKHLKLVRKTNPSTKLTGAQLAIARAYGFSSWRALKAHVEQPRDVDVDIEKLVKSMQRAWAESIAIIERRTRDGAAGPRWVSVNLRSPTLTERQADEKIIARGAIAQYRMTSIWHVGRSGQAPTRALELLDTSQSNAESWQAIDWRPTHAKPTWKANRFDDLADAIAHIRQLDRPEEYRVITVRRMLWPKMKAGKLRVIKKHFSGAAEPASSDPFVQSLPEHRKSHKIVQWKPLMDAAFAGDVNRARKLLDDGADPNVISTTPHRYRPLHRAIEHKKTMPKHTGHEAVVKLLLERGADPKLRATYGKVTALALAATGETRFVPLLRGHFEPLNIFHAAVLADEKRVEQLLRSDPALAKARDQNQWTALHYTAASHMYRNNSTLLKSLEKICRMLLDAGADVTAAYNFNDEWPLRPLYFACGWSNNPAVAKVLLDAGADPCDNESVYHASDEGHQECLDLIEKYVDPKKLAREASMCLATQMHWRRTTGMKWLLAHGADPNVPRGTKGNTALHEAVSNGLSEKVVQALLDHGARADLKNKEGKTALQMARESRKTAMIKLLN